MDVNAIVFHVSISAFNEQLDYEPTYRLQNDLIVWSTLCQSKLITKVPSSLSTLHPHISLIRVLRGTADG